MCTSDALVILKKGKIVKALMHLIKRFDASGGLSDDFSLIF